MCGIFGIVFADGVREPDPVKLGASLDLLRHRGPDSSGTWSEPGLGLAHTRLSLLDLNQRASQPFWDDGGRYVLVYNGEIYNFKTLRTELEQQGRRFRTTSDTEVLLQALIVHGVQATLVRLQGMFAFAFYDKQERRLTLARDRFGIKPLSVYSDKDCFLFSSSIGAMRPWIRLGADPFAISSYLLGYSGPTRDESFYADVRIVPPGSVVEIEVGGEPRFDRFIRLTDLLDTAQADELEHMPTNAVVDRVDELLQESVRNMLFADAPVGALCSGGVDSSLILAMAARHHDDLAIFHVDVKGPSSEHAAALALSRHLGLELRTIEARDQDFIDLIPEVSRHYEHPFDYHPNSVPFLMVSRLVREHGVKAVLSGEGSDECFLGYDYLARQPFERFYRRMLRRIRRLVHRIPRIGRILSPWDDDDVQLVTGMLGHFERELDDARLRADYEAVTGGPADWNIRTLYLLAYHLRTLLHRNDCLGMAASIEARFPFLDETLTKTVVNLPHRYKIRFSPGALDRSHPFLRDKWVLREVAKRYLPPELSLRKKQGFPVHAFDRMHIPRAYFRRSFVSDYFSLTDTQLDYLLDNAGQSLRVNLLLLDVWGHVCLNGTSPDVMQGELRRHVGFRD